MEEVVDAQVDLLPSSKGTGGDNMAFVYDNGKFRWEGDALTNAIWTIGDLKPMEACPFCHRPFIVRDQEDDEEECQ
jgi:hypothetical protein